MRANKVKFMAVAGSQVKQISEVKNIPVDTMFYKTLEFIDVEELNNFIGELISLKEAYLKKCLQLDFADKTKQEKKDQKIRDRYEKYIRSI